MQAVRFTEGRIEVVEKLPSTRGGAVRISVAAAGICGSDLGLAASGLTVTPGHEFSGHTDDGRAVAVQPNIWCGTCDACTTGHSNTCVEAFSLFSGMIEQDGGFAPVAWVHPEQVHELPESLSVEAGALAEPAAVAWHAVDLLDVGAGEPVVIVGGGSIGLLAGSILGARAANVFLLVRHDHQLRAAAQLGIPAGTEYPDGMRAAAVLDAAGSQSALDFATERLENRGRMVTLGMSGWEPRLQELFLYKELTVRGSVIYTADDFRAAIRHLATHPEVHDVLVTHRFRLGEAPEAFDVARHRGAGGAIKVLICP